ncbi:MAG: glycosyltransferase, partial [bacterium]
MKIVIAAGGTGGHIYPGIALAQEIRRRETAAEIVFLGSRDGLERELVAQAGFKLVLIKARALMRTLSYKSISAPFLCLIGFFQSLYILKRVSPKWVVATGGYVSWPVVLAARLLRIPIVLLEQNVFPGAVNRLLSRFAKKVYLNFQQTLQYLYGEVAGNPVRQEIKEVGREAARAELQVTLDEKVVLVMGGSQGA